MVLGRLLRIANIHFGGRRTQDCILGNFQPSPSTSSGQALRDSSLARANPGLTPDFLHAALDRSAYAAFFTESRTRLIDSTKLHRKSGSVLGYSQPKLSKLGEDTVFSACILLKRLRRVGGYKIRLPEDLRSTHPLATTLHGSANPHFVIPSELRISYYAALINGHVCGFL